MRRVTSQTIRNLQVVEGITVSKQIYFSSVKQALEFYYNNCLIYPKGISYEKKIELGANTSNPFPHNDWLDILATIGIYLNRLGLVERLILALFYGGAGGDQKIGEALNQHFKVKNYSELGVRYIRLKTVRILRKRFTKIGIIKEKAWSW